MTRAERRALMEQHRQREWAQENAGPTVHSVPISAAMREKIMNEGFPAYQAGGAIDPVWGALRLARQYRQEGGVADPFLDMLTAGATKAVLGARQWPEQAREMVEQPIRDINYAGNVSTGEIPYNRDEAIQHALRLAGTVSGGAASFERPSGSLASGAARISPAAEKVAKARLALEEKAPGLASLGDIAGKEAKTLQGRTIYGPEQDLGFAGKSPREFTPEDWGAFGRHYGVGNLGPASNAEFEASRVPYKTLEGNTITVPGGIEDANKPFTYYDLLHLKAQGIDPNKLDPDVHRQLHNRMMTTMSPEGDINKERIFNQYLMGLLSPNNPLTANQFGVASMMAKEGDKSIERLARETPWSLDTLPPPEAQRPVRDQLSKLISGRYGLQESGRGGLGASGSVDYSRVSDFAKMMQERPDFFKFRGNLEGGRDKAENWLNFVSRIASQVPGLSAKTGSFSTVWQNVKDAAISAIDRHMATELNDKLFVNPKERQAFEKTVVDYFNADKPKKEQIKDFNAVIAAPGGRGAYVEQVMNHVNKHGAAKFRTAKGEINPNVPEFMKNVDWVREPSEITKVSPAYLRALEENDRIARLNNQGLFANQWMLWDRIRNRIEPHEIMFPGLEKLPRMSHSQLMDAYKTHMLSGYGTAPRVPKQIQNPSELAHFTLGASPVSFLPSDDSGDESSLPVR